VWQLEVKETYVIRARFVGSAPAHLSVIAHAEGIYLGKRGHWCSIEKALRFKTRAAAETVLDEKWSRLRSDGNKKVILSVVQLRLAARRSGSALTS